MISTDDRRRTMETEIKLSQDKLRTKSPGGKGSKMVIIIRHRVVDKRKSGLYQDESFNWLLTASDDCLVFKINILDCQKYKLDDVVPTDYSCSSLIVDMTKLVICELNQPYLQEEFACRITRLYEDMARSATGCAYSDTSIEYFCAEECVKGNDYRHSQSFPIYTEQHYQNRLMESTTDIFEQLLTYNYMTETAQDRLMEAIARLNMETTEVNLTTYKPILRLKITASSFEILPQHQNIARNAIEDKTVTEDRTGSGISMIVVVCCAAIVLVVLRYWRGLWRQLKKVGAFVQISWRRVRKESKRADINKVTVVSEMENNKEEQSPMEFTQSGTFSPATSPIPRIRQLKSPVGTDNTTDNVTCISEKLSLPSASTPIDDRQYQQSLKQIILRYLEARMNMSGCSSSSYSVTLDEGVKQTLDIALDYFLERLPQDVILDEFSKQNFMRDIEIRDIREQQTTTQKNRMIIHAVRCRGFEGFCTLMEIVKTSQISVSEVITLLLTLIENILSHPEKHQSHDETDHDTDDTDNSM